MYIAVLSSMFRCLWLFLFILVQIGSTQASELDYRGPLFGSGWDQSLGLHQMWVAFNAPPVHDRLQEEKSLSLPLTLIAHQGLFSEAQRQEILENTYQIFFKM